MTVAASAVAAGLVTGVGTPSYASGPSAGGQEARALLDKSIQVCEDNYPGNGWSVNLCVKYTRSFGSANFTGTANVRSISSNCATLRVDFVDLDYPPGSSTVYPGKAVPCAVGTYNRELNEDSFLKHRAVVRFVALDSAGNTIVSIDTDPLKGTFPTGTTA